MVVGKLLLSGEQIQKRIGELADQINDDYREGDLLAIGILKGAFMFFADLIRLVRVPVTVDFIISSSYIKDETSGEVKIHYDVREPITGRNVLLIEDIVDTGITLNYIRERLLENAPHSLKICTLLDKKEKRIVEVPIDYRGFSIPDEFVIGYGIDYDDTFRNLPYISVFKKER